MSCHSRPDFHRGKLQQESRSKRLDSPVLSTGQAYQVRNDKMRKVISEIVHYERPES